MKKENTKKIVLNSNDLRKINGGVMIFCARIAWGFLNSGKRKGKKWN